MTYRTILSILIISILSTSCKDNTPTTLPKLGLKKVVDGVQTDHIVRDWTYMNSDSITVTNKDLSDVIYVSDFFFRSCPTICPKVAREMKRVYTEFEDNPNVKFVSFTLDPKRDSPQKLKEYAANLQVSTDKWWFLHGDKDETYELTSEYLQIGFEDEDAPGGFDHSGKLILTDKEGHIRSFSEGTDPNETPKLIRDIHTLLKEYEKQK